ncbi:MAG: PIN domain-containing protein [Candidatus Symbiodolus clandestinus]
MAKPNHIVTHNYQQFAKIAIFSNYREAYIAAVTASELLTGVHLATNPVQRIHRSAFVESIIAQIPVLDFNQEVARVYAELYAFFLKPRKKSNINVHDLLIATTAITHGFAVLTSRVDDFKKIPGLIVENPAKRSQ